jgi:hypothetical protein
MMQTLRSSNTKNNNSYRRHVDVRSPRRIGFASGSLGLGLGLVWFRFGLGLV